MTQAPDPISWAVAMKTGKAVAAKDVYSASYLRPRADAQMADLTEEAEALVAAETGLDVLRPARAVAADRPHWVEANVKSFSSLLAPLTDKLSSLQSSNFVVRQVGRNATGAQIGLILGWMSGRVLGQYDPPIDDRRRHEQDAVYYVMPNVMGLEKRFAFPPEEFRLWIAAHECTHRAQFMGVPWMVDHFRSLVHDLLSAADPDTQRLKQAIEQMSKNIKERRRSEGKDSNLLSLLSSPEQQESMQKLTGLMSLLEGHAEVVMSRATKERIPNAERFERVIAERRAKAGGISRTLQRALGMEAKLKQYAEGANFVRAVEQAGGRALFDQVWSAPGALPTQDEIREPNKWVARRKQSEAVVDAPG